MSLKGTVAGSSTEDTCCDCHRGVNVSESVLEDKPANPWCHPVGPLQEGTRNRNTASRGTAGFLSRDEVALVQQLRMLAPEAVVTGFIPMSPSASLCSTAG